MAITEQEQAAAVAFDALAGEPLDLKLAAAQLHRCRQDYQLLTDEYNGELASFHERIRELVARKSALAAAVEVAEDNLREAAMAAFEVTRDKHPGPGVTIREHQELRYDEEEVREWCRGHLPIALERVITFKRKVFEAVVDPMGLTGLVYLGDGPLVTKETTYSVAIDRDLDKALLGEVAR